jgi:hypothetical protein
MNKPVKQSILDQTDAVVTADVPANTVVGGVPAKIIETIN